MTIVGTNRDLHVLFDEKGPVVVVEISKMCFCDGNVFLGLTVSEYVSRRKKFSDSFRLSLAARPRDLMLVACTLPACQPIFISNQFQKPLIQNRFTRTKQIKCVSVVWAGSFHLFFPFVLFFFPRNVRNLEKRAFMVLTLRFRLGVSRGSGRAPSYKKGT